MAKELTDAMKAFSAKLARFSKAGHDEREVQPTEDGILQQQILEREKRFKENVVSTYRLYKSPFSVTGRDSERGASLDKDEQNLLRAYNVYKSAIEAASSHQDKQTFISKMEITSPLSQKAVYTDGGQFIYLLAWLYFEQKCSDFIPCFKECDNHWELRFAKASLFVFDRHDKEIFDLIKSEFYS